jgi:hypothetical protein
VVRREIGERLRLSGTDGVEQLFRLSFQLLEVGTDG